MKRLLSFLMIVCVLASSFVFSAAADSRDFEIKDGVLLSYNGSSADVNVPDGVVAVADQAFKGDKSITSVTLPGSLYKIGEMAFYGCSSLRTVKGGASVSEVGSFAFSGTEFLDSSRDPYVSLGRVLLWYNGPSSNATLPSTCVSIAPYAFAKCTNLKYFRADDGLLSIGDGAFYGCSALSIVIIPGSVVDVGAYAFDGTPYLDSLGDFPIVGDDILVKYMGSDTAVTVPDGVRRVASRAFSGLSKLSAVYLPDSVYSVDRFAFADCLGLSEVRFSSNLVNISDGAFRGCKSLVSLETPDSLTYIGQYAFCGASSLRIADLFGSDLDVSYNAFKDCSDLRCVLLTDDARALYDDAFSGCTSLEGISISPQTSVIGSQTLSGCEYVRLFTEEDSAAAQTLISVTCDIKGDVNGDEVMDIVDVSVLQAYVAKRYDLDGARRAAADFNYDGIINVTDATRIQRKLVHLI